MLTPFNPNFFPKTLTSTNAASHYVRHKCRMGPLRLLYFCLSVSLSFSHFPSFPLFLSLSLSFSFFSFTSSPSLSLSLSLLYVCLSLSLSFFFCLSLFFLSHWYYGPKLARPFSHNPVIAGPETNDHIWAGILCHKLIPADKISFSENPESARLKVWNLTYVIYFGKIEN